MTNPNDPAMKSEHQDVGRQIQELEQQIASSGGQATPEQQTQLDQLKTRQRELQDQMGTARQANIDQQQADRRAQKDQGGGREQSQGQKSQPRQN